MARPAELTAAFGLALRAHLEDVFRRHVLAIVVREERLHEATAAKLGSWYPSGFSVFLGEPIPAWKAESRQRLARYLVKGPVSLERMDYDATACQVRYVSVKRNQERCTSGLDFLADLSASIPDRGEHSVTYHGRYSNRARGTRRRQEAAAASQAAPPGAAVTGAAGDPAPPSRKAFRLAWAALLARV